MKLLVNFVLIAFIFTPHVEQKKCYSLLKVQINEIHSDNIIVKPLRLYQLDSEEMLETFSFHEIPSLSVEGFENKKMYSSASFSEDIKIGDTCLIVGSSVNDSLKINVMFLDNDMKEFVKYVVDNKKFSCSSNLPSK